MNEWFDIPRENLNYQWLVDLLEVLDSTTGITESPWIEVKSRRDGPNVAEAVGSLANADGGIVIVGVLRRERRQGHTACGTDCRSTRPEYDNITMSLRSSLEDDLPDIVPIAIPHNPDAIVLVLLVDADAFAHPVVVNGKVKIRVGSSSTNADRSTVERLVDRNRQPSALPNHGYLIPINAESMPFWDHGYQPYATFRIRGSLRLPQQAVRQTWFPTSAVRAAIHTLNGAILPDRQWLMGALAHRESDRPRYWDLEFRRARDFRVTIQPEGQKRWPLGAAGAGAYVAMNGLVLTSIVALWLTPQPGAEPLTLNDIHDVLLSQLVTSRDLLRALAGSLSPTGRIRWGGWTGWIQPGDSSESLDSVINFSRWQRAASIGAGSALLPETSVRSVESDSFVELVREWLLLMLAANGVLGHEEDVDALNNPSWLL